ncbi:hypothetical protein SNOG_13065 [Parastagonospora nodorum SN15]|uniref:Uncharacterized protein n=1 Tax=Phaeosphaeria nodorum (strain SN15 / ATCC MYA-4574 / FGSC 10173) TaxID=321614 RepID=Q0U599_PHANO|nr:hypothetical protein SNOG_13065 [Parastagonospora nodorum SN15]EAT79392.1 hypothetical protein SNOG_13065 [Parastagonospora nodorum SN15]
MYPNCRAKELASDAGILNYSLEAVVNHAWVTEYCGDVGDI